MVAIEAMEPMEAIEVMEVTDEHEVLSSEQEEKAMAMAMDESATPTATTRGQEIEPAKDTIKRTSVSSNSGSSVEERVILDTIAGRQTEEKRDESDSRYHRGQA